jgi:Arc/MetJ-type ribon-helix-helix transcriptional regulator
MPIDDFRGISLRKDLIEEIEKFIESFGRYKSVTDFVTEAVRLRLEELQKQYALTINSKEASNVK